jgi:4-diphosphocytidyl-2-C-methyl-D-erythritol kinase
MPTSVLSHAKINLGLYIGTPRPDGYHSLVTAYQTLEMHEVVTVSARHAGKTTLRLTSNDRRVPLDGRNTAWKIISLALEELGISADVEIHIEKRLPVQGGLGAGSANAVAALVGLEKELGIASQKVSESAGHRVSESARQRVIETVQVRTGVVSHPSGASANGEPSDGWGTHRVIESASQQVSESASQQVRESARQRVRESAGQQVSEESPEGWGTQSFGSEWAARRLEIAAAVGSDVPLFLVGGAVLGEDRGQKVTALPDFEQLWCVVAAPEMGVSTPRAFRDWDAICAEEGLTEAASASKLNKLSQDYLCAFGVSIPGRAEEAGSSGVLAEGGDRAGRRESELVRTGITSWIENDFERVVFRQHPSLAEIKLLLWAPGTPGAAVYAALSGSGSALFGLYRSRGDAEAALKRVEAREMAAVKCVLTQTLPRAGYWRGMLLESSE